jgi:hypothetical protein
MAGYRMGVSLEILQNHLNTAIAPPKQIASRNG